MSLKNELLDKTQYFSTTDSYNSSNLNVYINTFRIPDIVNLSYTVIYNKIPIYSYNSEFFSAVAPGNSIISGTLGVVFTETGYFEIIRKTIDDFLNATSSPNQATKNSEIMANSKIIVDDTKYWFGLFSHQRNSSLWKGMLSISLDSDDMEAEKLFK